MSDQKPTPDATPPALPPQAPYGNPYGQQPYGQQPYGQPAYAYRTPSRPPLSKRVKVGTVWAGAVGFNVLTLGFYLVLIPLTAAMFGAFFAFIADQIVRSGRGELDDFVRFFGSVNVGLLLLIGGVVVLVGLGIMWAGLAVSTAILKRHGTHRAWPVTWAGAGIAIVGFWVVGWIPGVVGQLISLPLMATGIDQAVGISLMFVLIGLGMFVGNAIIGWLSWWWMAFVLRAPAEVAHTEPGTEEGQR